MTFPLASTDRALSIYTALAQYPILRVRIRARMRRELFERGVITPQQFEAEVHEKAVQSQKREGVNNPLNEEPAEVWETRLARIRSHLTDFYFAYNLPYELFERILMETLAEQGAEADDHIDYFNPELAPQNMLFEQALAIENLPPLEVEQARPRLQEIKVVLIRRMISDQLAYINIAKEWITVEDLIEINRRKIGQGKIGGKAAGMLLALRILDQVCDRELRSCLRIPDSFFLGADVMYTFMAVNNLLTWNDQKYKSEEQIRADYPRVQEEYLQGKFPPDILAQLRELLDTMGNQPLIVRSSSLLEDNFGTSFAGKYESVFCPNQRSPEANLQALTKAIAQVYASVVNPDALLYRRQKGLQDYDERMAILIQAVQGERVGRYYLPHAAGVAFSRNLYRWSPQIKREDGFLRLVWGLGTRAVDQVGHDYPRLVALSHPLLHPEASLKAIQQYSQQNVDVIDLEDNIFKSLPVDQVLHPRYPVLRYLAQIDQGGYLAPIRSSLVAQNNQAYVLTFDELLRRTPLAERMRSILKLLEANYHSPVDTEFTVRVLDPEAIQPQVEITLLQCRPQSHLRDSDVNLPQKIQEERIVFSSRLMVPRGRVDGIEYVIFVSPGDYFALPTEAARKEVGRLVSRLNAVLAGRNFICLGPGRWGTRNLDLGVFIGYSDIYNTRSLIELSGQEIGFHAEPSFGTHFFQDLVEADIYPLVIDLDDPETIFNRDFFYQTPNRLASYLPKENNLSGCLHLIEVNDFLTGFHLNLVMDDEQGRATAFLSQEQERS